MLDQLFPPPSQPTKSPVIENSVNVIKEIEKGTLPSSAVMSLFKLLIKPEVVVSEQNDSLRRESTYHITNLDKENIEETTDGLLSIFPPSSTVSTPGQCFNTTPKPYKLDPTNTVITADTTRTYPQNPTNNQQILSCTCSSADKQKFTPRKSPRMSLSQEYRVSLEPSIEALNLTTAGEIREDNATTILDAG
ncbi:Hypothetical predicted protein [Mytilus galloprovincialis]|uniref:Uncharacterized protein n=1 Tax=Mytilus galloprovincialis TaxID=29158 RepID=A0A8B6EJB8_MYTGA|nr:Hypothetical predicted protein [Mytilus galloprovincialis]